MSLKQLGVVKYIVESAGMEISYAYDDLVFINHNALLLQFMDKSSELVIHVNSEADESAIQGDMIRLKAEATAKKMSLMEGNKYTLSQGDDENIRLEFME